jgi:hypothetical protein
MLSRLLIGSLFFIPKRKTGQLRCIGYLLLARPKSTTPFPYENGLIIKPFHDEMT